jgi:CheY-like chemotaxis protein
MKHSGPVILAIDDNKDNLVVLNAFVTDAFPGSSVFSALNGKHGIELAREKDPDVVLLDILMPGMDGFEVCRQLKADPCLSHIPVVFLTALKDDRKSRIRALEVGGEAFISKPFDEAELTAQIRAMVKIKAANEREWREKEHLAELVAERTSQLEKELAERKLVENTLHRVNQKLNLLSELTRKDLTSHLFVLNSYLGIVKNHATGQDLIIDSIQKAKKAAESISEITEITRDYQDMGVYPPRWQNVNMALLLGLSHTSPGEIQHSIETGELEVFADPLLEKAFQGLVENSLAHGEHVTRIRVWHTGSPDGVTIVFEDDGTGIPLEKKESIFLRGSVVRASIRSLIFVQEILDITGISIKETGEPGKGARFEMTVPKGMYR